MLAKVASRTEALKPQRSGRSGTSHKDSGRYPPESFLEAGLPWPASAPAPRRLAQAEMVGAR